MTSSYTAVDSTKPAGTQTGPQFAVSANSNDVALWYGLIAANPDGWVYAPVVGSGTAEQPQYMVWTNGAFRVRGTLTWGVSAGATGNITQIIWEVSQDSGSTPNSTGTWAARGSTQTMTYDANGNLTATTNAGGFATFVAYLIGKVKGHTTLLASHTASLAALGTMSTQGAGAVAITGGTINGATIGVTTPSVVAATNFEGVAVNLGNITGTVNIDWNLGDYYYGTQTGVTTITFSNLPASGRAQGLTLEVTNPGAFAWTWPTIKWPSATAPTRTVSGIDLFEFSCRDGATVRGVQSMKDSR